MPRGMVATNIPTMAKTTDNMPNTISIIYILFFLSFGFLLRIVTTSKHSANFKFPKFYFKLNLQPINKSYFTPPMRQRHISIIPITIEMVTTPKNLKERPSHPLPISFLSFTLSSISLHAALQFSIACAASNLSSSL